MSADLIGATTIYQEYLDRLHWSDIIDHRSLVIGDLSVTCPTATMDGTELAGWVWPKMMDIVQGFSPKPKQLNERYP